MVPLHSSDGCQALSNKETEPRGGEASRRDQSEFCAERVGRVGHGGDRRMREASAMGTVVFEG